MDYSILANIVLAYYKDKVQQEILNNFLNETHRLLKADANARRQKARENIMAMAKLRIELGKFKSTYSLIAREYGECDSIARYINQIEVGIRRISYTKNKSH